MEARDTNGLTPLHRAARSGSPEAIEILLAAGAAPDALDNFDRTPLQVANRANATVLAAAVKKLREAVEALESPSLEPYYTLLPLVIIDPSYRPHRHTSASADLDGDGNEDLVLLGYTYRGTATNHLPQPGRVFLGDGDGGFRRAPDEFVPGRHAEHRQPELLPTIR